MVLFCDTKLFIKARRLLLLILYSYSQNFQSKLQKNRDYIHMYVWGRVGGLGVRAYTRIFNEKIDIICLQIERSVYISMYKYTFMFVQ